MKKIIIAWMLWMCGLVNAQTTKEQAAPVSENGNGTGSLTQEVTEDELAHILSVVNSVETNSRFLHELDPDSVSHLPFGIMKQIGNARYTVAVDSMCFKPHGAYFSAYAAIDFPGTTRKLAFRGYNIKFNPSGVIGGEQARLYLAGTHVIRISNDVSLRLRGGNQNWVEWNCTGFKAVNLVGDFIFSSMQFLPDTDESGDTAVTASFQIYTEDINNMIASVSITPFMLKSLKGWSFRVTNAVVDLSETHNAVSMRFPDAYDNPNLLTPQMWTGFSLQSLVVKLPPEISSAGQRTEVLVNDLLIEKSGLTGMFTVKNLFPLHQGSLSGWAFSLEELSAGFIMNRLSSGYLKGRIRLPIMDSLQSLAYNAGISYNKTTNEIDYNFMLSPVSNINISALSANITLHNSSHLDVIKTGNRLKPKAVLNGLIAFNNQKLNTNGGKLSFEKLTLVTDEPYVTEGFFTLHNIKGGQTRSVNYPVNINDISFGIIQGAPVFGFSVTLNLSDNIQNSLTVGTSILIKGKIEAESRTTEGPTPVTYNVAKWKYDRTVMNGISVDLQTSPVTIAGTLILRENDPQYGNAFFGSLFIEIKKVIEDPIAVSVCFGSKENFRYFYLDTKVTKNIELGPNLKLTRIIGGVYYHMKANKSLEDDFISMCRNFNGVSGNALNYIPDIETSIGMKAGVSYEYKYDDIPLNGDVMFGINFTLSGGLGLVSLSGDVYSFVSVSKRDKAPVKGKMSLTYDAPNKTFDAIALVSINAGPITGGGTLKIHFDPQIWYIKLGSPSAPISISYQNLIERKAYFMTGNSLEGPMPPPGPISAISSVAAILGNRDQQQLANGGGFCAGMRYNANIDKTLGFSSFNAHAYFNYDLGFDMMLTNYGSSVCQNTSKQPGLNGWLASGNMYLCMNGNISINGNIKFPADCPKQKQVCFPGLGCQTITVGCLTNEAFNFNVLSASLVSVVSAQAPSPVFFEGVVNCEYNILGILTGSFPFNYSYGSVCVPVNN